MFPKLYKSDETNFTHNGLGLLTGTVTAIAIEELNGMFELNMEYDSEGFLADVIEEEMLIKAKANDKQKEQLFRIYSITKNHENDNLIIDAQHITYDLANNFVEELEARNLSKNQVMEKIGASTNYPHPFILSSPNTSTQSSTSIYRTNPLQMVGGTQGSVLQIWGGQIERDNYHLILHDRRGSNDGVLVSYKKNLTGLNARFDISNLVTRIFPFVYDEFDDTLITVPGKYIDSPNINNYEMPYILPVDYSHEEGIETSQDLMNIASNWFTETGRDKPKVEMEVQFEHLWETEEYKDVAALELVGMGDTITVKHSKLKIEAAAIVNRIEYDVIAEKNRAVDVGNVKAKFTDKVNDVSHMSERVEQAEQSASQAIRAANGKNTIYYGPDEPTGNFSEDDLWFRVVDGEYTRTYRYDGIQWQLVVSKDVKDIETVANEARNNASEAVEKANLATSNANEALQEAQTAFDDAQNALGTASNALDVADDALTTAQSAIDTASHAASVAESANELAELLQTTVNGHTTAISNIENELSLKMNTVDADNKYATQLQLTATSSSLSSQITSVQGDVDNLQTNFSSLSQTVSSLTTRVGDAEGNITTLQQTSNSLAGRLSDAEGNITTLTATVNGLQTIVSDIDGNVSNLTQLSNTLQARLSDAEGNINTLTLTSQSMQSTISSLQTELDELEIGGRNLLRNSDFSDGLYDSGDDRWQFRGTEGELTSDGNLLIKSGVGSSTSMDTVIWTSNRDVFPSTSYLTMTFKLKSDSANTMLIRLGSSGWSSGTHRLNIGTELKDYSVSFPITTSSDNTRAIVFWLEQAGEIEIDRVKLEKGNKATDWTPAPEDYDFKFNSLTQTIDSTTSRIGDAEGNISALQQTSQSFANRISNAEGDISSLTQTAQGLQNRIADAEDNIATVTNTASALQTRMTDAEGNINTLTSTASSLEITISEGLNNFKNIVPTNFGDWESGHYNHTDGSKQPHANRIRVKELIPIKPSTQYYLNVNSSTSARFVIREYDYNGDFIGNFATMSIGTSISSSNAYYIGVSMFNFSGDYEQAFENGDIKPLIMLNSIEDKTFVEHYSHATQTQITQLSDAINLRVMKGDVINQINIDTSGVLIGGKKLILDGDTTVTGTFRVGNANITSIDAGKLTTGTLDAGQVSLINLRGLDIYGSKFRSTSGTDWMDITGGNVHLEQNSGRYVNINPDGIYGYNPSGSYRFRADSLLVTSRAFGTTTSNVYLSAQSGYEARVVRIDEIPSDGEIGSYFYLNLRANHFYGNVLEVNAGVPGNNLYLRPRAGGEVRITGANTTDAYYPLRAGAIYSNNYVSTTTSLWMGTDNAMHVVNKGYVENSSGSPIYRDIFANDIWNRAMITRTTNAYVGTDNELRVVNKGLSNIYRAVRAERYFSTSGTFESAGTNLTLFNTNTSGRVYLQSHIEVRATKPGSPSSYIPVLASDFVPSSSEQWKTDIAKYEGSALNLFRKSVIYQYHKHDSTDIEYGFITERETPSVIKRGEGISIYSLQGLSVKAIQEVDEKIDLTREEIVMKIAKLEERLNKLEVA